MAKTRFRVRFRDCTGFELNSGFETAQAYNSIPRQFRVLTRESWHFGSDSRYFHLKKDFLGKKGCFKSKRLVTEGKILLNLNFDSGSDSETWNVWLSIPVPIPRLAMSDFRFWFRFPDLECPTFGSETDSETSFDSETRKQGISDTHSLWCFLLVSDCKRIE